MLVELLDQLDNHLHGTGDRALISCSIGSRAPRAEEKARRNPGCRSRGAQPGQAARSSGGPARCRARASAKEFIARPKPIRFTSWRSWLAEWAPEA